MEEGRVERLFPPLTGVIRGLWLSLLPLLGLLFLFRWRPLLKSSGPWLYWPPEEEREERSVSPQTVCTLTGEGSTRTPQASGGVSQACAAHGEGAVAFLQLK